MSKLIRLLALLLLAWLSGSGLHAADSARTLDKNFSGATSISITLTSGDCRLHPAVGKEVRVRNQTTLPVERFQPEVRQDKEQVVVKESYSGSGWTRGKVEWDIWVPEGMAVAFHSASGDLDAKKLVN
ncbi:MAG: hypothetical protein JXA62_01475, partial [Candidatus Aminicenantes bacterium]|nr:hypothetical protein [Candidatus Aminicenantes bacterium]